MNTKPILFSTPMILALLAGTKTQTRRIADVTDAGCSPGFITPKAGFVPRSLAEHLAYCPYGRPGDLLWVREAWQAPKGFGTSRPPSQWEHRPHIRYRAGHNDERLVAAWPEAWKPGIHMPRWASRLTLRITDVRVQRLQEISEEDAIAEGAPWAACGAPQEGSHKAGFAQLWESINGAGAWSKNPWVWCVSFEVIRANVDSVRGEAA
jgi:hypothetical protein